MKTKTLIASVALAFAAVSAANAQIYVRAGFGVRRAYGRVVYAYNYPVAPVVVAAAPVAPAVVPAPAGYVPSPAPAVVYAPAPVPSVVVAGGYGGGGYRWTPRYSYGRGYFYGHAGWRR